MARAKLHGDVSFAEAAADYARIEDALRYLEAHAEEQPDLATLAGRASLSLPHFQRIFQRWAGVSPKRFLQYLTKEHARSLLAEGTSVLDTSLAVGLSAPSRLHDLLVEHEALSPGELKRGASGLALTFDLGPSPFGLALFVESHRGLVMLSFLDDGDESAARREIEARLPAAAARREHGRAAFWAARVFRPEREAEALRLHLRGTAFQLKVWQALLAIPEGSLTTYAALARAVGMPSAARAVGTAVGQNPIACLIPCHRVIRALGTRGGYRWGPARKAALIALEQARMKA